MASMADTDINALRNLLSDGSTGYPVDKSIEVIASKSLYKGASYWKALLLVRLGYGGSEPKTQLRLYGWELKNGEWKQKQKFNVSRAGYVYDLIDAFGLFMEGAKVQRKGVEDSLSQVDRLQRKVDTLEKKKSSIPELKRRIRDFESILDNPESTENDINKFLRKEAWMFGAPYSRLVKSEKYLTIKSRNDFLLRRLDDYYDVIELKSPKSRLFVNRGSRKALSKDLKNAISQVIGYLSEIRKYYLSIKDQTGMDIFFPKGIIVIGRASNENRELLKSHNEFFHNLVIWTFDDLISSAQQTIEVFKRVKPRQ